MNWRVEFARPASQQMVDELGLDPALRLLSIVKRLLPDQVESWRSRRDPKDPGCFLYRYQPLVVSEKGGWFECVFSIDDQTEGVLLVLGFFSVYRPIGPLRMGDSL